MAQCLGYPHWNALTVANKKGWLPSPADQAAAERLLEIGKDDRGPDAEASFDEAPVGAIQGHEYRVSDVLDDTFVRGRGWEVVLPEAPLARPQFLVTDRRLKANPIGDQSFRDEVLAVATRWRKGVHAGIASDWPPRSTVPDSAGRAEHPLGHGVSDTWWCMHCDQSFTGRQVAANLFHCPNCLASPLDIHASPWWLEQERQQA